VLRDHTALSRAVGFAGSALIAIGGLGAGALPVGVAFFPSWQHARLGLVCVYSGLALLLAGWWWYGRAAGDDPRGAWRTLALWVSPLLLAPPMFSRDVYSYLAQGLMIDSGSTCTGTAPRCWAAWSPTRCRRSDSTPRVRTGRSS
jgi:alpha-1,6-mannosyltransferase